MRLRTILEGIDPERSDADPSLEICSLAYDSRRVRRDALFFAVEGFKADGHAFIGAAAEAGAAAAVTGRWVEDSPIPQFQAGDVRSAMAAAAGNFFGHPSRDLTLAGVTGTNGKTTTTFLLDSILRAAGKATGIIGGVEYRIGDSVEPATRTTPEAIDSQEMLARAVAAGVEVVSMEVSSHGLELHRIEGMDFDVAVFTHLRPDHLAMHADMETYFEVKKRLFGHTDSGEAAAGGVGRPRAVVNLDDGYGKRLAALAGEDAVTFGLDENAMVRAADMEYSGWETRFTLVSPEGGGEAVIHLPGRFNLHNSLAAAAAALALGVPTGAILSGLASAKGVPGRFEPVEVDTPFRVIIDYAHNEDGLRRALKTASRITSGRLITVFGCPGERDREKRPRMGKVAGSISDISILTTDDCYGEDPESILDEVEAGLSSSGGAYRRQEDRRLAIETALSMAAPDDTVLIAGKGHERFQRMKDGPHPFSDRTVVLESVGGKGS